jgi:hypothetical protein
MKNVLLGLNTVKERRATWGSAANALILFLKPNGYEGRGLTDRNL